MTRFNELLERIEADFYSKGIPVDQPGFYDHPNFIEVERQNPEYLNNYARYVQLRFYSSEYLEKAEREIPIIAHELHMELLRDGRQGACVDMSGVLSKILEREGYWNFVVKGSLTITFPKSTGIGKRYFWSVDKGEFVAGHAWVFAPPFQIVDLTLKQQQHKQDESKWLPEVAISKSSSQVEPAVEDIISPEVRGYLRSNGIPEKNQLEAVNPTMVQFLDTFPTYQTVVNDTSLKYVPVAVGAPDCPLEEMVGISLKGMSAMEMYTELVLPKLSQQRA